MDILNLPEHIRILEELILHQDFSDSPDALDALLAEDFREINPDGKEVSRQEVINWLMAKNPASRWEFSTFDVSELSSDVVMATYFARQIMPEKASRGGARHLSIWQQVGPGKSWQLKYHQSTRINNVQVAASSET